MRFMGAQGYLYLPFVLQRLTYPKVSEALFLTCS